MWAWGFIRVPQIISDDAKLESNFLVSTFHLVSHTMYMAYELKVLLLLERFFWDNYATLFEIAYRDRVI